MIYNIYFEASAIAYLIILNVYIRIQYNSNSENNRRFQKMAFIMLLTTVLDVITAVTIDYGHAVPILLNLGLNALYHFSNIVLSQVFLAYCIGITRKVKDSGLILFYRNFIYGIAFLVHFINLFTGILFFFDSEGNYVHGKLYFLVFAVPIGFILLSILVLISGLKDFSRSQRLSVILYIIVSLGGCAVQILMPHVLFILFAVSLGLMMLMFSMETPDYQSVQDALKKLEDARDEAEDAMRMAQAADIAKSDFLTGLSHELRTPINAILGYNGLIVNEAVNENVCDYAAKVQSAGNTLLALISSLIDFGNIEKGNVTIENHPYYTASMLRDIIEYAEYNSDRQGLELRLHFDNDIPSGLNGDCVKIKQIFINLISNAAKFTPKGYIEIGIRWFDKHNGRGIFSAYVRDSGIGIKEEDIPKITAAFEKTDYGHDTNARGVGVGLTIVSKLLNKMGGTLRISSEFGSGASFAFEIEQEVIDPAFVGSLDKRQEEYIETLEFTAPDVSILAVDDNEINLDLIKRSLKKTEVKIDTAANGVEALSLIGKKKYDIIFLDHMMPVMDGVETINTIKKQNLCPGVPVIVVTANAVAGEKSYYFNIGFDDYLSKPVSGRQLMAVLKKHLPPEKICDKKSVVSAVSAPVSAKTGIKDRFPYLDTKMGIEYCCGDEDFYVEMIQSFVSGSKYELIKELFDKGDLDNYRIHVHALKTSARTIGAAELGDKAERLEKSQKAGNTEYVLQNHDDFMKDYGELLHKLTASLAMPAAAEQNSISGSLLIIDDDAISAAIYEGVLSRDFAVSVIGSAEDAFSAAELIMPDAVILDVHLNSLSGFDIVRKLKADTMLSHIPFVFVTADDTAENELACIDIGAADFIAKPFCAAVLSRRIKRVIENAQALSRL